MLLSDISQLVLLVDVCPLEFSDFFREAFAPRETARVNFSKRRRSFFRLSASFRRAERYPLISFLSECQCAVIAAGQGQSNRWIAIT
jgi:hypothetical protein